MSLNIRYRKGELLTYSVVCYSLQEGMRAWFSGDRGRIEYREFIRTHMNRAVRPRDFKVDDKPGAEAEGEWIKVYPHFKTATLYPCRRSPVRTAARMRSSTNTFMARASRSNRGAAWRATNKARPRSSSASRGLNRSSDTSRST